MYIHYHLLLKAFYFCSCNSLYNDNSNYIAKTKFNLYYISMFERQTKVSVAYWLFWKVKQPLSVAKITSKLNKRSLSPNKTTIYRIVKKLIQQSIVTEFNSNNGLSYYKSKNHHHHFFATCVQLQFT